MKRPKIGDIFEVPISQGRMAIGQYLLQSKMGPIVQILGILPIDKNDIEELLLSKPLFPPVIVGLFAAIQKNMWRIIGNKKVTLIDHPKFISNIWNEKTGKAGFWTLWDGNKFYDIGHFLPSEYRELEFLVVWTPQSITERIETGKIPFPYGDLIQNNEFTPVKKI